MFNSRKGKKKVINTLKRAPEIGYKDFKLSFQELVIEDNFLNIHQKLITEI